MLFKEEILKDIILDSIKEHVILYDKDMNILYANKSAGDSLNLPKEELINKKCYNLWHKRESICENCPVKKAMDTKMPQEAEIKTPNGRIWFIRGYPVLDENGNIIGAVELTMDITEKKKMEEEIKYLSFHDSLTGLYNRYFFEEELRRLNTKRNLPLTVIMGDLNGLKLINDAFGHEEGDKFIIAIADVLRNSCRKEDIIARWGGDEFTILLPKTDKFTAQEVCERIKRNCEKYSIENNNAIKLSISLGYATKEEERENIEDIIKIAEDRMYRNKLIEGKTFRESVLLSLKSLLWENSYESKEHEDNIETLCLRMADYLYLSDVEREKLSLLSHFHDIGEIALPPTILKKNGPLNEEEWEIVKKHPEIGYRIAGASYELSIILDEILSHHEWWNGEGYPRKLKGEDIPLVSRIFMIADAYDVMIRGRPYKKAKTKKEAIEELKRYAGIQFDPNLVPIFLNILG
ncbi:MAG: histidine kinase [Dictyoglomus sp. NZ13-RE01]|nr:MAG: histidine kinase [Dictyoglomus sp. NZ13-RE01]